MEAWPTKFMRGHGLAHRGHGYGDLPMAHSPPTKFMRGRGPAHRGHGHGDLPMVHSPVTVPPPGGGPGCLIQYPVLPPSGGHTHRHVGYNACNATILYGILHIPASFH